MHDKAATVPVRYLWLSTLALHGESRRRVRAPSAWAAVCAKALNSKATNPTNAATRLHNTAPVTKARHKARGSDGRRLPDRMHVKHGSQSYTFYGLIWSGSTLAKGGSGDSKKSCLSCKSRRECLSSFKDVWTSLVSAVVSPSRGDR